MPWNCSVLETLPGIDRPAIVSVLPNPKGGTYMLDLGANVDCGPEHLLQFAVMGSALVAAVDGKEEPSVGLLNIGEEAIKGSDTIKRADEQLRSSMTEPREALWRALTPQLFRRGGLTRALQAAMPVIAASTCASSGVRAIATPS